MDILKEIKGAESVVIGGHIRPDGDCVGSVLALYNYIRNASPALSVKLFLEKPSMIFKFLKGFDDIDSGFMYEGAPDVFIALDTSAYDRLGDACPIFDRAKKTICIDHHESNVGYAMLCHVEPDASSASEVLYHLLDKEYVDNDIAACIYTGIAHDSGVFQYSCANERTFMTVAELMKYDFDSSRIIDETFYQKTYLQNQILGRALLESILFMDGKCIASCIDRKQMDFYGVDSKDFEGIVNQLRLTKGVEVAIFMYELRTQEFKVSMRSNGKVNVSKVASYFGGGGHFRAAGCTMNGTMHDVLNALSEYIEMQL